MNCELKINLNIGNRDGDVFLVKTTCGKHYLVVEASTLYRPELFQGMGSTEQIEITKLAFDDIFNAKVTDIKPGMAFTYPDDWLLPTNQDKKGTNWVVIEKATYSPATGFIENPANRLYWCQQIGSDGVTSGEMIICCFDDIVNLSRFQWKKYKPKCKLNEG